MKCDHYSMFGHTGVDCRKKKSSEARMESGHSGKGEEQNQQDIIKEFETPRRIVRRSPPNMRGNEEPTTNSF